MNLRIDVVARGHGFTSDAEMRTVKAWGAHLFAPDRAILDTYTWEDKRGLGFNLQTYLDDDLVGFAHVFVRRALANDRSILVGCLGSVMTAPERQANGIGSATVRMANQVLLQTFRADLGVLLCKAELIPFYAKHDWQVMNGLVTIAQAQGNLVWPHSAMLLARGDDLPDRLDLCGPPF